MSTFTPSPIASYASVADVRSASGIDQQSDVSNGDLDEILKRATARLIADVSRGRSHERVAAIGANRQTFRTAHGFLADVTGSGAVSGDDVRVRFLKRGPDGTWLEEDPGAVTVTNAWLGIFDTENPLPAGFAAFASYRHYFGVALDLEGAKRATVYFAAHLAAVRVKGPGRVTRADTKGIGHGGNRNLAIADSRSKWLKLYNQELPALRGGLGAVL